MVQDLQTVVSTCTSVHFLTVISLSPFLHHSHPPENSESHFLFHRQDGHEHPHSGYRILLMLFSIENDIQMEEGKAFDNRVMSIEKARQ